MAGSKDKITKRELFFRYLSLILLTAYLAGMCIVIIWLGTVWTGSTGMKTDGDTLSLYRARYFVRQNAGITIIKVDSGGAAAKAGLRVGDRITAVNGLKLSESPEAYSQAEAGSRMEVQLARGSGVENITLYLDDDTFWLESILFIVFFVVGGLIG